jgi:16S rRNA (cytidine1402-2'-O)-methyltransferase
MPINCTITKTVLPMAKLYIVATPIGNLEDITFRAINTLKSVDAIACEDTRKTAKLLHHYSIEKKRLLTCHTHNERSSAAGIIKLLQDDQNIAYCSDAGTPGISDPGARLVASVLEAGLAVEPIPGVSALATLYSVAGQMCVDSTNLHFAGFLPQRGQKRTTQLAYLLGLSSVLMLYESPYRIEDLLQQVSQLAPDRLVLVGREMTKMHEEFWRGTAGELVANLKNCKVLGEFAVIIGYTHKC